MQHMPQIKSKLSTPNLSLENLSEALKTIALGDIELNPILQARAEMKPQTLKDYEKAYSNGAKFPPLLVAEITDYKGDCAYLLLDGWHRRQAMENINWGHPVEVKAVKIPIGTPMEQLIFLGGRENLSNGLPLSSKDKRALFKVYVKGKFNRTGRSYKSYREIASDLKTVTHQTLHTWMKQDFPAIAKRMSEVYKGEEDAPSSASGTGHVLAVMPDLATKDLGLIALDIIEWAKASDDEGREQIANWLSELVLALKWEAPFTASKQLKTNSNKVNLLTLADNTFSKF